MRPIAILLLICLTVGCQPKALTPINQLIGKVWKAQSVKENTVTVYTEGASSNVRPGYTRFRLDLSRPDKAILIDIDGRTTTGTWSLSTDNQRLILENLEPKPSATIGTIEYYILGTPTATDLQLQRTAESRKTGNSVNEYVLKPEG
ncbi:hypothetical protein GCM10023187_35960 [Nibrella viscosa]|uniref:Lipocalin-like domain-containing protein n=1 Tax=Nibrella viscosa TaxID=1084524 RepID=A0ABP8KMF8_9BACT